MMMKEYIDQAEESILHTYNRFQIVLDKGEGVFLYDTDGKEYLDFVAGIAVFAFGYHQPEFTEAIKQQADKLLHTSNYFYNVPSIRAAKKINALTGMSRVFFTNSGTEAVEGAIKAARKYAFTKDGHQNHEIIAMERSFHGRSHGALTVTGNAKYRAPFLAWNENVKFATFNDYESVIKQVSEKTCAIIMETVQGEGGIVPADKEFLKQIRTFCDEHDILLIFDEIQCGMGRTGTMFAYEQYGVKPDILTLAKALGGGVPVGAFLVNEKVAAASLVAGDHGTTYGGNPFATAAVDKSLDLFEKLHIIENVTKVGAYLQEQLDEVAKTYECVKERRGIGMMQALELDKEVAPILRKALDEGLILINAGPNIIRFVPPLIINEEHVDRMISILKKCLDA